MRMHPRQLASCALIVATMSAPCLCSLDATLKDYVVISDSRSQYTPPEDMSTPKSPGMFRLALMHVSQLVLRKDDCCRQGGWTDYPNDSDPDHSIHASHIFLDLREKIQENRRRLRPPVTTLDLKGYRYQPLSSHEQYTGYYFLRIQAGDNFYLYVKVGLTNDHIKLLRLASTEDKATSK